MLLFTIDQQIVVVNVRPDSPDRRVLEPLLGRNGYLLHLIYAPHLPLIKLRTLMASSSTKMYEPIHVGFYRHIP
jgi:hypothetical protein